MKIYKLTYMAVAALLSVGMSSCDDFLDRPTEDSYNAGNFYQNDEQCIQGVNYLYNSPWYDFQRGFIKVGECLSGNEYMGSSPYLNMTVNGTDEDLVNMSYSLWAVIGHSNVVYNYIKGSKGSEEIKKQCMGECLTWKAMAYFYLVRTFGDVPIIHDNTEALTSGSYNDVHKIQKNDVYEYIVMTLEKAIDLLPVMNSSTLGRIDKYAAEGLLAKVYLAKAGLDDHAAGQRNQEDLDKAAYYSLDVIENSGRHLLANYSDNFRLTFNKNEESLISWQWSAGRDPWTQQNTQQSDLAMVGFDEFGDCWGGYRGPSVDLQEAFGISAMDDPSNRPDVDTRRKATMMMAGDVYSYFWQDKGGFDYLKFIYDAADYGKGGPGGILQSPTGANHVKHLYGNINDHISALGVSPANMAYQLATHILRLSDVYLIYAEAKLGNDAATADAKALKAFNDVRGRAIPGTTPKTVLTFDDIWKERRLELAMEGDRWYDFVRLSYYNVDRAINEIKGQHRNAIFGLDAVYKNYYETGSWTVNPADTRYDTDTPAPNVTAESFTLPFPTEDVVFNPNLASDAEAIHVDVRSEYNY